MRLIHTAAVKRYVLALAGEDKRISAEFLDRLEGHLREQIQRAIALPYNRHRKTIKDF